MIDTNELRRKLGSDDLIDHFDIHANVKPTLTELIDRLEAAEKERDALQAKVEAMEKQFPICRVKDLRRARYMTKVVGLDPDAWLYLAPGAQPAPSVLAEAIIADMQAQHDSELITENDSGEALIRLDGAIAAVEDNFALAQPAPSVPNRIMPEQAPAGVLAYCFEAAEGYADGWNDCIKALAGVRGRARPPRR